MKLQIERKIRFVQKNGKARNGMKRVTTMTDHIKNEAEVEENNMKVKINKSKAESIIYIIGMGPGSQEMMTQQAKDALEASDVIVGYTVYVDLLRASYPDKEFVTTPMRQEIERCRICFSLAGEGKQYLWYAAEMRAYMEWQPRCMNCNRKIRRISRRSLPCCRESQQQTAERRFWAHHSIMITV